MVVVVYEYLCAYFFGDEKLLLFSRCCHVFFSFTFQFILINYFIIVILINLFLSFLFIGFTVQLRHFQFVSNCFVAFIDFFFCFFRINHNFNVNHIENRMQCFFYHNQDGIGVNMNVGVFFSMIMIVIIVMVLLICSPKLAMSLLNQFSRSRSSFLPGYGIFKP